MEKGIWNKFKPVVCLFFCLLLTLSLNAAAVAAEEIKVPVTISLDHPIAGAQFQFRHTDGLEFVSFERSEAVKAAMMTPDDVLIRFACYNSAVFSYGTGKSPYDRY